MAKAHPRPESDIGAGARGGIGMKKSARSSAAIKATSAMLNPEVDGIGLNPKGIIREH